MKRTLAHLAATLVAATLLVATPAWAVAAGDLDSTFGSGGTVMTSAGSGDDVFVAVAIQPADQKIVAVGHTATGGGDDWLIARYNPNGTLDATFGSGGIVTTSFGSGTDHAHAVAIDASGKIVVAGYADNGTSHDFAVARYTTTGALDPSFASGGTRITSFGSGDDEINAVAIDGAGKIVVAGQTAVLADNQFAVARYTASGALDTSFGSSGKVKTNIGPGSDAANAVVIQADGKIIAGGRANNGLDRDLALVRYTPAGAIDTGYANNGKRTTAVGPADDEIESMALDASGRLVVAGYTDSGVDLDFMVARYTPGGSLDGSFNGGTPVTTNIGHNDVAYGVAIQADGKIVVSGTAGSGYVGLARYTTSGPLDVGFGTGGTVYTAISPFGNDGYGEAIQADGSIVVVGDAYGTRYDGAVARYLVAPPVAYYQPDGAIRSGTSKLIGDNAYNTTAKRQSLTVNAARGSKKTFSIRIQNDGSVDDQFTVKGAGNQSGFSVRYLVGTTDVTSLVEPGTYTTATVASGSSVTLKLVATVKKTAALKATRGWLVSIASVTQPTKADAVKALIHVTR